MEGEEQDGFVISGLNAVKFNIVKEASEIYDKTRYFSPELCHQIFRQTENVFGYGNLKINIIYAAASMNCFVDITYSCKLPIIINNVKPDNIMELLEEWLPVGYTTSKTRFLETLEKEDATIVYGDTLDTYEQTINGKKRQFILNHCSFEEEGFKEFHSRLETWIVWYIDAASVIDTEDHRWLLYVLYEKCEDSSGTKYYPTGYCTVYKYYAYPEHIRPRISQFIILPPYQKMGLGTFMLKGIYKSIWAMPQVRDITVEDPSDNFQKIRDVLDASFLRKELPSFTDNSILEGFKASMSEEACRKFKINARQARRIYEILKYANVKKSGKGLKEYKAELIRRVETPLRRQEVKLNRLGKAFKATVLGDAQVRMRNAAELEIQRIIKAYDPVVAHLLKENE